MGAAHERRLQDKVVQVAKVVIPGSPPLEKLYVRVGKDRGNILYAQWARAKVGDHKGSPIGSGRGRPHKGKGYRTTLPKGPGKGKGKGKGKGLCVSYFFFPSCSIFFFRQERETKLPGVMVRGDPKWF